MRRVGGIILCVQSLPQAVVSSSRLMIYFRCLLKPSPFMGLRSFNSFSFRFCSYLDRLLFSSVISKSQPPTLHFIEFPRYKFSVLSHAHHAIMPADEFATDTPFPAERVRILKEKMKEIGIDISLCNLGEQLLMLCPDCEGGDSGEKSLNLFISADGNTATWTCSREKCGRRGRAQALATSSTSFQKTKSDSRAEPAMTRKDLSVNSLSLKPLSDDIVAYFADRNISKQTLQRNHVMQLESNENKFIAFTYQRNGVIVNCKYRDVDKKNFWQEKNTEKIFYGVDDIIGSKEIIIVEGEMDKLSMEEAGYPKCVSVPQGAPSSLSSKPLPSEEQDSCYQYLWNCKGYIDNASRIILATDGDSPGQILAEELARRFGKERCWRIRWPEKEDGTHCKDANDVLMYLGRDVLREVIQNAELYPIQGLFNFSDFFDEIDAYYYQTLGYECGVSTGWGCLNDLYNVVPGELTLISGVPNSGKSEWIDALLCNINATQGWKFGLCSMENRVREHARKLLEKHVKKPFFDYGKESRMNVEEFEEGKKWINDTFCLIRCDNDSIPNIKWILDLARAAVLRYGIRGLVIDPYNELDHQRSPGQTETEYVSHMLTLVKRFALHHACHVWFVAHPRQLQNWDGRPPGLYDVSGSAHFINKCDNGIIIHRNRVAEYGPIDLVQVCVRKVRNKVAGCAGDAFLTYKRATGEYFDAPPPT